MESIDYIKPWAVKLQDQTGIPASITIAQYLQESGTGKPSQLASVYNNPFGVKADAAWQGKRVYLPTKEHLNGVDITTVAAFRSYDSIDHAIQDRAHFLSGSTYAPILNGISNPFEFAKGLQKAGYATDPNYATNLIDKITTYNLTQFDKVTGFHPDTTSTLPATGGGGSAGSGSSGQSLDLMQSVIKWTLYILLGVVVVVSLFVLLPTPASAATSVAKKAIKGVTG